MDLLSYLFWPNPGNADYSSPKSLALLAVCLLFILGGILFSFWRKRQTHTVFKRLSAHWSAAAFWFGCIGIVLVVARVEEIQFIAMRFLWVLWIGALAAFLWFQVRQFRARYYRPLPATRTDDPRAAYLPRKKKR